MKNCKSCNKEIDDLAYKCPYCQSFQKWYKNQQMYGFLFPIIFIPYIFFSSGLWGGKNFNEYRDNFETNQISKAFNGEKSIITFAVKNNTKHKWSNINYRVVYRDKNGTIINVDNDSVYAWVIDPNSNGYISHQIKDIVGYSSLSMEIIDLKTTRF